LAALPYSSARLVWTLASLTFWLLAVYWLTRAVGLGGLWPPALLCVAAVFEPAMENLRHGQFHVLVLVLLLIAWHGQRRRGQSVTGASLGVALAMKVAGAALWPFLLVTRQWRALAWAAFTVLAIAAVSVPLLGIEAWHAFIERAGERASAGSMSVTAYQTLPGLVRRLAVEDPRWNPSPLLDLGTVGITLSWVAVAIVLVYSLLVARRVPMPQAFAAFVALGLAISPVSLDYHYVVAILPVAVLLSMHRESLLSAAGLLTLCALAMIGLDLPYRSPRLAGGWTAVVAYPKLYGALILWWLLLRPDRSRLHG
jgi:alpha-1,2-mannosyltransferase